ncbi:MAG TPA: phosphatase PAP2-related protein [Ignavibacteriaceae bacterium]|nr:phosphatase PAP2-related protein [Ignavibacteriaceae bacterium]
MTWGKFLKEKYYRNEFIISLLFLLVVLFSFTNFLNYNETRDGIVLADPILHYFNPIDLTWSIFIAIYLSLVLAVISLFKNPKKLIILFQAYTLLLVIRMVMMFLMPLDPPPGMIPLNDVLVQSYGTGQLLTKDLFFSGHTATLFLLFLTAENKLLRKTFLVLTIIVGISVLLQHVHYAVDVASAPFFSYLSYRLIYLLQTKGMKYSLINKSDE